MSFRHRPSTACAAALLLLQPSLAWTQDIKPPIRGLVSMGAYRFVGYGGDPANTLEPLNAKPGIFGGLVVIASWKQLQPTPDAPKDFDGTIRLGVSYGASSIELYQDYGGFPLVSDAKLRQWAAMIEANSGR